MVLSTTELSHSRTLSDFYRESNILPKLLSVSFNKILLEKSTTNCDSLKLYHEKVWLELQISFSQMGVNWSFLKEIILMFCARLIVCFCTGQFVMVPLYMNLSASLQKIPMYIFWIKALIALLQERNLVSGIRFLFCLILNFMPLNQITLQMLTADTYTTPKTCRIGIFVIACRLVQITARHCRHKIGHNTALPAALLVIKYLT